MISFTFKLLNPANKFHWLYLISTDSYQEYKIGPIMELKQDQWDQKNQIVTDKCSYHEEANLYLKQILEMIDEFVNQSMVKYPEIDSFSLLAHLYMNSYKLFKPKFREDFFKLAEDYRSMFPFQDDLLKAPDLDNLISELTEFWPYETLPLDYIDEEFIHSFESHLRTRYNDVGIIKKCLYCLKYIYRKDLLIQVMTNQKDAFFKYEVHAISDAS